MWPRGRGHPSVEKRLLGKKVEALSAAARGGAGEAGGSGAQPATRMRADRDDRGELPLYDGGERRTRSLRTRRLREQASGGGADFGYRRLQVLLQREGCRQTASHASTALGEEIVVRWRRSALAEALNRAPAAGSNRDGETKCGLLDSWRLRWSGFGPQLGPAMGPWVMSLNIVDGSYTARVPGRVDSMELMSFWGGAASGAGGVEELKSAARAWPAPVEFALRADGTEFVSRAVDQGASEARIAMAPPSSRGNPCRTDRRRSNGAFG